jgi:hypothetical protein
VILSVRHRNETGEQGMTPEELLDDLETCRGPCGKLCLSCPEGWYLSEIRDVIVNLMKENEELRKASNNE